MVASLLRIVHSGPQNERLNETFNHSGERLNKTQSQQQQDPQPSVKFFQKIFRPSGRFTTQWVRLDFNTPPNFGQNATIPLPKKGHLLSRLYLITNYPTSSNSVDTTVVTPELHTSNTVWNTVTFSSNIYISSNISLNSNAKYNIYLPDNVNNESNTNIQLKWNFSGELNNILDLDPNESNITAKIENNNNNVISFRDLISINSFPTTLVRDFETEVNNIDLTNSNNSNFIFSITAVPQLNISNLQYSLTFDYLVPSIVEEYYTYTSNISKYYPSWTNSIGHALIESAELQIGGARIERLDGQLMEVLDEFNTPLEKVPVVNRLIGRQDNNYIQPANPTSSVTRSSNLIITSNLNYLTESYWNYYYETTSNLVVTSNTGYNLELVTTSNLSSVTYIPIMVSFNCNYTSIDRTGVNPGTITLANIFTVPNNYVVGCNVTINYNFSVDTTFNPNNINNSRIVYRLQRVRTGFATTIRENTFSNTLPPTSIQPEFLQVIPNVNLQPGDTIRQLLNIVVATNLSFSNIRGQLYFTYPTSNDIPTSNYTYTYSLESNFYVNYTSEYVYSQTLLSNEVITQIPYYTYESNSYVITSNYTTRNNFAYLNPLSNPLVTATPLPFFFCRGDAAAALPVDAIQADEIRLQFAFRPFTSLYTIPYSINNTTLCNYYYTSDILMSNTVTSNIMSTTPSIPETLRGDTEGSAFANPFAGRQQPTLGDTYLLAEYIYLDAPEANRFRIADITLPITQHYSLQALDTQGLPQAQIDIQTPNPVRDIFFYCQPWTAPAYNAHFLATKYIGAASDAFQPWWPDADGLNPLYPAPLKPGFYPDYFDSEPVATVALQYEGRLTKLSTANPALFRSIIPSLEQKKSPWVNRYYYNISLGLQHGVTDRTRIMGEANYDKITKRDLQLTFPREDDGSAPRLWVRPWVETYNILRIYGGRAGTLFGY